MSNPFFQIEADMAQVRRMQQTMQSMGQFQTAAQRALNRGLSAAKAEGNRQVRQRYDISLANVNKYSKVTLTKAGISGDGVTGTIYFAGQKIPLYRYNPQPKTRRYTTEFVNGRSGWRKTTAVSAADVKGQMTARPAAFIATFASGHTGIFRRTGAATKNGKAKLTEYWGFSIADMLDYEDAREAVLNRAQDVVAQRLEHEINAALNGSY